MEQLSPESRALYDLLKADTDKIYERKFIDYKKEILNSVRVFVKDTTETIDTNLEAIQMRMGMDLEEIKESLGGDIVAVQSTLSSEISKLASTVDRATQAQ